MRTLLVVSVVSEFVVAMVPLRCWQSIQDEPLSAACGRSQGAGCASHAPNELDPDMIQAHLILLERLILSLSDILAGCSWTSLSIALHRFREIVARSDQLFKAQFAGRRVESDNMQNATIH